MSPLFLLFLLPLSVARPAAAAVVCGSQIRQRNSGRDGAVVTLYVITSCSTGVRRQACTKTPKKTSEQSSLRTRATKAPWTWTWTCTCTRASLTTDTYHLDVLCGHGQRPSARLREPSHGREDQKQLFFSALKSNCLHFHCCRCRCHYHCCCCCCPGYRCCLCHCRCCCCCCDCYGCYDCCCCRHQNRKTNRLGEPALYAEPLYA